MTNLSQKLKQRLVNKGASLVGYADLSEIPAQDRDGFNYGIAIAVALSPQAVSRIYPGPSMEYYEEYHRANDRLNELAGYAVSFLKDNGYEAFAKTQSAVKIDPLTKRTKLPHKTLATRAGMGWIGKCALLITEEFGAAVRISTTLTNAELDTGAPINDSKCGDCMECQKVCPAGAVSGKAWRPDLERDDFFRALDCRDSITKRGLSIGLKEGTCGLCIWSCPWTRQYLRRG